KVPWSWADGNSRDHLQQCVVDHRYAVVAGVRHVDLPSIWRDRETSWICPDRDVCDQALARGVNHRQRVTTVIAGVNTISIWADCQAARSGERADVADRIVCSTNYGHFARSIIRDVDELVIRSGQNISARTAVHQDISDQGVGRGIYDRD